MEMVYCMVTFVADMDLCYAISLTAAFETAVDQLCYCWLESLVYSDFRSTKTPVDKNSRETVGPIPRVSFVLLSVGTDHRIQY